MRNNSIFSLMGFLIPSIVIFFSYPVLLNHLGASLFGILIILTSISGLSIFLDFGLSSATLKYIAEDFAINKHLNTPDIIVTSLILYFLFGILISFSIYLSTPFLIEWFSIPIDYHDMVSTSLIISSIQFSVFFITTLILSILKGLNEFKIASTLLSLLSILSYGGAILGVLLFDAKFIDIVCIFLYANMFVLLTSAVTAMNLCKSKGIYVTTGFPRKYILNKLFGFGSAISISCIAHMLNSHVLRFVLSAMLGPQYVTSFHVGVWGPSKLNGAVLALSEPLFPKSSELFARKEYLEITSFYKRYVIIIGGITFVGFLPIILFSDEIYTLWFKGSEPAYASDISVIAVVGLFFNSLCKPAHHILNGIGKPWINTWFSFVGPTIIYSGLGVLLLCDLTVDVMDFAILMTSSLMISSIIYLYWFNFYLKKSIFL